MPDNPKTFTAVGGVACGEKDKSVMTLKEQAAYTARLILPNEGRGLVTFYLNAAMCEIGYEIQGTTVKSPDAPPWGPVMRRGHEITDVRTSLDRLLEE